MLLRVYGTLDPQSKNRRTKAVALGHDENTGLVVLSQT